VSSQGVQLGTVRFVCGGTDKNATFVFLQVAVEPAKQVTSEGWTVT
jgi:hypothetical protein